MELVAAMAKRVSLLCVVIALLWKPSCQSYRGLLKDDVCKDESFSPRCATNQSVLIRSAWYGRMDKACGLYYKKPCQHDVYPALNNRCHNKTTCSVKSSPSVFGNPCRFYEASYLEVLYWCLNQELLSAVHETSVCAGASFTADCGPGHVMQILSARYGDDSGNVRSTCGIDVFTDVHGNCSSKVSCQWKHPVYQRSHQCIGVNKCLSVRYMCLPQNKFEQMTTPFYPTEQSVDLVTWKTPASVNPTTPSPVTKTPAKPVKPLFNELELVVYSVVGIITILIIIIISTTCYSFHKQRKRGLKHRVYIYSEVTRDTNSQRPIEMSDMSRSRDEVIADQSEAIPDVSSVFQRSTNDITQTRLLNPEATVAPPSEENANSESGSAL